MHNARILGTRPDNTVVEISADQYVNALLTMDLFHHRIHQGDAYNHSTVFTIGAGATVYLLGKVGANPVHFNGFSLAADDGPITVSLFETPTITDDGTQISVINRNRISSHIPTFEVYTGPTIAADGDALFTFRNFSDSGTTSADIMPEEWLLAPNTNYVIKLVNTGGAAAVSSNFFWYEGV